MQAWWSEALDHLKKAYPNTHNNKKNKILKQITVSIKELCECRDKILCEKDGQEDWLMRQRRLMRAL